MKKKRKIPKTDKNSNNTGGKMDANTKELKVCGQRYSIFSNYRWGTKLYEELIGKEYHFVDIMAILLGVTAPFVSMAFPSAALGLLQSGREAGMILVGILIYVVVMKFLMVGKEDIANRQQMNYFMGRLYSGKFFHRHILRMDYEVMESPRGQAQAQAAEHCFYWGDFKGIECFLKHFPLFVQNLIGFLIYSLLVVRISPWVILYMMASTLLLGWLNIWLGIYQDKEFLGMGGLYQRQKKAFAETIDREARADMLLYQAKDWLMGKLRRVDREFEKFHKNYGRIAFTSSGAMALLNVIRDGVVYGILIGQVAKGALSVNGLLLFVGAVAGYSGWLKELMKAVQEIVMQNHFLTDYRNFLEMGNLKEMKEPETFTERKGMAHELRLKDVCYRYEGAGEDTIRHVNLTIHPGEKLALVGANGAGKTTLVKLMTGLYQPTSGKIYLDGVDVATIPREAYFREFAAVFQDSRVFACSVAQNVSCEEESREARVKECLKLAGLWEKVETLPEGIHQMMTRNLSETGVELSGGEVQKLMLARALYREAPVLILDEPTAALDPIAESNMYETYGTLGAGKTGIFISHRLSSTRFCDRICFLQEGQVTETGTHEELLAARGAYANMYEVQAHYYKETERQEEKEAAYEAHMERILGDA